jgi:hypothetical protein
LEQPKKILILTYWSYQDALIQTYTLPYVKMIAANLPAESKIYLITLDKRKQEITDLLSEDNIENLSIPYVSFGIKAAFNWIKNIFKLYRLIKRKNISVIHVWCTPAGMIGYILSVMTRRTLIIDSYEPHAESMVENGAWKKNSFAFNLLFKFEKLQSKKAKYLICTTDGMKQYAMEKYNLTKNNFFTKPACVDLALFSKKNIKNKELLKELNIENKIICVYAGKFGGIYLDKEVFDFFKTAETFWGDTFIALILSSHTTSEIKQMAALSKLHPNTIIHKFVPHHQIPNYIGLADFAITPVKPVPTKKYCTPIKNGEYWALGLPVVITKNISDDSDIIKKYKIGSILEKLNEQGYLKTIKEIDELIKKYTRSELYTLIRPIAEKYRNYSIAEDVYKAIYTKDIA